MKRLLVISASVLVLAASGCGGGGGGSSNTAPASSAPAPAGGGGGGAKVEMKNIQFNPKTLNVNKGTTVVWTNEDSVNHDVTKQTGPGPNFSSGTGNIGGGGTYKHTFNTPGTIEYHCTVHPGMTATIVVK